jgi:acetoin utilization deacetylase AcuC-like enzyme
LLGSDGKRFLVNIPVPAALSEAEVVQYFDDIYREAVAPQRPKAV